MPIYTTIKFITNEVKSAHIGVQPELDWAESMAIGQGTTVAAPQITVLGRTNTATNILTIPLFRYLKKRYKNAVHKNTQTPMYIGADTPQTAMKSGYKIMPII